MGALRAELGEAVRTDSATLAAVRSDRSGHVAPAAPLAVVEAGSVADVQATLRIASAHGTPVVPRGAGTGVAGGAIGSAGEIVLSTARMTRILEVAADDLLAVVEPGILNGDLNDALAPLGLWWAPDPASRRISSVGGNIATNAGGLLCVKYGVTREAVLGLTVVLPDGRLLRTGQRSVKGVTGLDLTSLLVGSEGTLGVIVEATLRLRPLPRGGVETLSARFGSVEDAARAVSAVMASGVTPAMLELLEPLAVAAIESHLGVDLGSGTLLFVRTDGPAAGEEAAAIAATLRAAGGSVEVAPDAAAGERLFDIRRAFHPALVARGPVLIEDVAVPRSALAAMFAEIARIGRDYGVAIPTVAHAGDGNLHPNFVLPEPLDLDETGEPIVPEHLWAAADELFRAALRVGGTLTGEHGIGTLKRRWLRDEVGDDSLEIQRGIKAVFDPRGILNPGKVW